MIASMSMYVFVSVCVCVCVSVSVFLFTRTLPHNQINTYIGSAEHQGLVGKESVSSCRSANETMQSQVMSVSVRLSDEVSGDIQVNRYSSSLSLSLSNPPLSLSLCM